MLAREFIKSCKGNMMPPTPTQMVIMDYILEHKNEEVLQRDLECILNLRRATVSGVLQTMEKHGLITRSVSVDDARIKVIRFNEGTKIFFGTNKDKMIELEDVVTMGLSDDELRQFSNTLDVMQKNLTNYTNKNKL